MRETILILLISLLFLPTVLAADVSICGTITESSTLTANILNNESEICFTIGADDIIFDCDGYTIDGDDAASAEESYAFYMETEGGYDNITIKNCIISDFSVGIYGSELTNSNFTNLTLNSNPGSGITIESASNNNVFTDITVNFSLDPDIAGHGIYIVGSNNILINFTVDSNIYGIYIEDSSNNTLINTSASNNTYNFYVASYTIASYNHSIDTTNTIENRPFYYLVGNTSEIVDLGGSASGLYCIACDNITFANVDNITNMYYGALFYDTNNSIIENVSVSSNFYGVYLQNSKNITLTNITATSNRIVADSDGSGIYLDGDSWNTTIKNSTFVSNWYGINSETEGGTGHLFYHNNFTYNVDDVEDSDPSTNNWHHPSLLQGNWWSNYTGVDDGRGIRTAGDGIGDSLTPYPSANFDGYPLTTNTEITYFETSSCGNITNDTKLTADILNTGGVSPAVPGSVGSAAGNACFRINTSNVIFDCQGYTIDGTDDNQLETYGIFLEGVTGVRVKNCVLTDFTAGAFFWKSSNNTLENITSNSNEGGMDISTEVSPSGHGIFTDANSHSNNITNTTLNSNRHYGVYLRGDYNNITDSTIQSNYNYAAIYFHSDENNNRVTGNTICYNKKFNNTAPDSTTAIGNNTFCLVPSTPLNATTSTNTTYNFTANVTNMIAANGTNCTFYLGSTILTNNTVSNNQFIRFSKAFTAGGSYLWNVSCVDSDGNSGLSNNWLLNIGNVGEVSCSVSTDCRSNYCVHGICRSDTYYCGDYWCDSGESCGNCAIDCGSCPAELPTVLADDEEEDEDDLDSILEIVDTTIEKIKAGEQVEIDVTKESKTKVTMLRIIPKEDAETADVTVIGYSVAPQEVEDTLTESGGISVEEEVYGVYQYIDIETEIDVESAEIEFEVSNQWMLDNGIIDTDVILLHYKDAWLELETEIIDRDASNTYFTAEADSFSMFAIGVKTEKIIMQLDTSVIDMLFNVIYLLLIVLAILIILIFVKKKDEILNKIQKKSKNKQEMVNRKNKKKRGKK